jgi:predicted AAA+ superfamily ATPase
MFPRLLVPPSKSFFLFGPRGTGKSTWVKEQFRDAIYLDLLESGLYTELLAAPERLEQRVPPAHRGWIVIDEVQRVPALLDEVHRLIENRRFKFALTGSSARKLKRRGVNLLAGRALTMAMHPLTCRELGQAFDLRHSLQYGHLPAAYVEEDPKGFLKSYVQTYLREEVQQEGLTRNLGGFARFLEAASFSQAAVLNMAAVARECNVERKVVEDYFTILEDLLLAVRVPVFSRKAKRRLATHRKFFLFDVGVFRAVRPRGPLDSAEEIEGPALETLVFQEVRGLNDALGLGYGLHYWRTANQLEVDLVLYGERGIRAIEVKRSSRVRDDDLRGLRAFLDDYPMAQASLVYTGTRRYHEGPIDVVPLPELLAELADTL